MTPDPLAPLSDERLQNLIALEQAATPGEWFCATSNSWRRLMRVGGRDGGVLCPTNHPRDGHEDLAVSEDDMALIADARNALPSLLAEVTRLRAAMKHMPQTKDGVPIFPGMTVYGRSGHGYTALSKVTINSDYSEEGIWWLDHKACYSTAALAAAGTPTPEGK